MSYPYCRAALGLALLASTVVSADTIVLRNGRRVEGEVVGMREGVIELQERGGRGRVMRFDRGEVRSIELEDGLDRGGDRGGRDDGSSRPRPRGMREREVIVSGDLPFVDSGIDVRAGQDIYFETVGNVWWRKNDKDGPDGRESSPYNPKLPMPRRALAALIGKIGSDSSDLFFIGSARGPMRMRNEGRLFLGVNDDYFGDNHGNFRVLVFY